MYSDPLRVSTPIPGEWKAPRPGPSLEALIGQALKITLVDGRIIMGYFTCVDKQCNIILNDAEEFRPLPASLIAKDKAAEEGRELDGELAEETEEEKIWRNREQYWPRSEPFAGPGTGLGGRCLSMVCMKEEDVAKVEVESDTWKWIGGKW